MGGGSDPSPPPPLRVVLGTLSDCCSSHHVAPEDKTPSQLSSSPAPYILGTSYFATPSLSNSSGRSVLRLNKDGRVPMEDRKGPLDQFKPKSLVLSTVRVTAINISTTLSTFFSDQLNSEQHIESRVDAGEITPREADEMNEEWENGEWELRKDALPRKIGWALLRFHACTALMRFYEFIVARYVLRVDRDSRGPSALLGGSNATAAAATIDSGVRGSSSNALTHEQAITVMDNLTRDPYQASRRTSQLLHIQEHSPGKVISSNGIETSTSRELMKRMFDTCIWANIIPFLAELTVQQGVLIYGYVVYYRAKTRRKREKREESKDVEDDDDDDAEPLLPPAQCKEEDKSDDDMSAYALSLMFRSSRLTIAKSMSWIVASAGGAVGSVAYPGWGCVFGIQIGDTVVGALID